MFNDQIIYLLSIILSSQCTYPRRYSRSVFDACVLRWGADQNTGTLYLSVNTPPKECGKERVSIQPVTHKEFRDGVRSKQYTGGEFLFNSVSPTLPPPPSRQSTKSRLFSRHPKKSGFCRLHKNDYPLYNIF